MVMHSEPIGLKDPRIKHDAYWALIHQGYPDAVARKAIRSVPPRYYIAESRPHPDDELFLKDIDPEDLFVERHTQTELTKLAVLIRPDLTEHIIATAAPRDTEYTIWSENPRCFGLRVRPSGSRSFIVKYRIAGSRRQGKITLGKAGTISLAVAREIAKEVLIEAKAGFDPSPKHKSGELMQRVLDSKPS